MIKGFKTVAANVIMIGIAVLGSEGFLNFFPSVPPETWVSVIAILNIVLRFFTKSPIFKK